MKNIYTRVKLFRLMQLSRLLTLSSAIFIVFLRAWELNGPQSLTMAIDEKRYDIIAKALADPAAFDLIECDYEEAFLTAVHLDDVEAFETMMGFFNHDEILKYTSFMQGFSRHPKCIALINSVISAEELVAFHGSEALMYSCRKLGRRDVVKICLDNGAKHYESAFLAAAQEGFHEIIKEFLSRPELSLPVSDAIDYACENDHVNVIEILNEDQASRSVNFANLLEYASFEGCLKVSILILDKINPEMDYEDLADRLEAEMIRHDALPKVTRVRTDITIRKQLYPTRPEILSRIKARALFRHMQAFLMSPNLVKDVRKMVFELAHRLNN